MPQKRRTTGGGNTKRKSSKKQSSSSLLSAIFSPITFIIVLCLGITSLIWWFLPDLIKWGTRLWESIYSLFGIGIFFIVIYLIIFILAIVQKRLLLFLKYGLKWLGAFCFTFMVWGIIALFSSNLGGAIGQYIISESILISILKLTGLLLFGIIFITPVFAWKSFVRILELLYRFLRYIIFTIVSALKKSKSHRETKKLILHKDEIPATNNEASQPQTALQTKDDQQTKKDAIVPIEYKSAVTIGGWQLPPINILDKAVEIDITESDVEKRAKQIEESLTSYGVDAKVIQMNVGPTVTQFGVEPGWDRKYKEVKEREKDGTVKTKQVEISKTRVKVERISSLSNDLALALAAPSIRIEAPVPGKSIVGIEVPNSTFGSVNLRSVIESPAYQKIRAKSKLAIALGKGAGGETVAADLTKMPHLLIAGSTGSGKTVYINSIICCSLINNTPDELKFIMIDPKRVELVNFNSIPHLISPVVVESDKAVLALRWLTQEMDHRYRKFASAGARNIEAYNKNKQPGETMPFILLVIDELADLMMTSFDEVEHTLCRLAQLARATGIHLIVATQRPSVDVITGLIKANFPTRISFSLTSQIDSRTILDSTGAEKLLGRGDMLYMPPDASKPKRLQGPLLTDAEIDRLVQFWIKQRRPETMPVKFEDLDDENKGKEIPDDPLLETARQLAAEHGSISTSFLQRRLNIGYPRAARLMDKLKEEASQTNTQDQN